MNNIASATAPPLTWTLASYRSGENTQIQALAQALELPFEVKRLAYRHLDFLPGLLRLPSLAGIDRDASSPLTPPWPQLLISAGMRNEPVCLWIKRQSPDTRLVYIGRTWAARKHFDLIITTPQYRLPHHHNILHIPLTLHHIDQQCLAASARQWRPRVAHLPPPYFAVLVGGNSGPYTFGPLAATRLAEAGERLLAETGGSLLITSSSRTPTKAMEALSHSLTVPHYLYRWRPNDKDNPYLAFLALAQGIIVTCDSVAMLSEACATGKPVYMFDLGRKPEDFRLSAFLYKQLMHYGPRRLSRDVGLIHRQLVDKGWATWLHDPKKTFPTPHAPLPDTAEECARIIRTRLLKLPT